MASSTHDGLPSVSTISKEIKKLALSVSISGKSGDCGCGGGPDAGHVNGCSQGLADLDSSDNTPKSPGSVFSQSALKESSGCILSGLLLCCWDNILGPKLRHLWEVGAKDGLLTHRNLLYIASHTLSGEICRDLLSSTIDFKFYALQEREVVLTAFIFGTLGVGDLAVHSLCVILPHDQLSRYLHWQPLCVRYIHRAIPKLRVLLEKVSLMTKIYVIVTLEGVYI